MRKIFIALIMVALILSVSLTAYAEESGAAVTLNEGTVADSGAVVVDWSAASPAADGEAQSYSYEQSYTPVQTSPSYSPTQSGYGYAVGIYPQNVETVTVNGVTLVKKTYEVSPDVNPESLVQPFEQDGFRFTKREILRRDLPGETLSRLAFKTAETDTDSDDAALIARQFPGVIEHEEDGYSGQLQLDASTLVTVASEYERYSYPYTKTREVPGLARNDPYYLDKEWNGMVLANVSFKQGAGGLYTATAVYKGTATGKRAAGYVSSVKYFGTLTKEIPGNALYTIIYEGVPIETEPPRIEPIPESDLSAPDLTEQVTTETPEKESTDKIPLPIAIVCIVSGGLSLAAIITVGVPSLRGKFKKKEETE